MNKYSLGGYRIAVQARSGRTLLVEGRDDKELFSSLKSGWGVSDDVVIDTHEIFDDPQVAGLGAKARIDLFIQQIPAASPVKAKVRCFVDREWEELVDPATQEPVVWTPPALTDIRLKSTGHSIENLGFSPEFVEVYLRHFGEGIATVAVLGAVATAVPELLRAASAFSEVARKRQIIRRCGNIVEIGDISWTAGKVELSGDIENKLISRGCANAVGVVNEFTREYSGRWSRAPFSDEAHLHAHGHIGEALLWAGVAGILLNHGVSRPIGQEIATGRRDEKRRVWHGWLAALSPQSLAPMDQALL